MRMRKMKRMTSWRPMENSKMKMKYWLPLRSRTLLLKDKMWLKERKATLHVMRMSLSLCRKSKLTSLLLPAIYWSKACRRSV